MKVGKKKGSVYVYVHIDSYSLAHMQINKKIDLKRDKRGRVGSSEVQSSLTENQPGFGSHPPRGGSQPSVPPVTGNPSSLKAS